MFDIRWIRDNAAAFDEGRKKRNLAPLAAHLLALDDTRRAAIVQSQAAQERRNAASKEIGLAMREKNSAKADALKAEVATLKETMGALEIAERDAIKALNDALAAEPNLPLDSVPIGADEHGNVELRKIGTPPVIENAKEHFDIGEALDLMDFETARRMSGSRFVVLKGALARLERALAQFMLDLHVDHHGFTEVNPPVLVRDDAMFGTAQLPKFEDDQFFAMKWDVIKEGRSEGLEPEDDGLRGEGDLLHFQSLGHEGMFQYFLDALEDNRLSLIPTAEVPLTNLVREQIVDETKLPLRYTADTLCFRAEAGAAGRDTRGMIRQHQFRKVEMVAIVKPEDSEAEHERMTLCAEEVLKKLGLPYRVVVLCTGDMGFASRKTHDIEVWLPGQGQYREISSVSQCGDFQARRMNARYRPAGSKDTRFLHTLNGSGIAVGRALVAVLENYQNADGSVTIPPVLVPYMGGLTRIEKAL